MIKQYPIARDDAPKAQIRGYSFTMADILLE